MSQCKQLLEYLMMIPGRRISTWIAYERYNITTLAQRVADLKKQSGLKPIIINGKEYKIVDELVSRDGKTFSEYWLAEVKQRENLFFEDNRRE